MSHLSLDRPRRESPRRLEPLGGECVAFQGRLAAMSRAEAEAAVRRLGGRVARRLGPRVTLVVVGGEEAGPDASKPTAAPVTPAETEAPARVLSEDEFCTLAGLPSVADLRGRYHSLSEIRLRYPELRPDRIRYLERWGLVSPVRATPSERYYRFDALALLASIHERLVRGDAFRAIVTELRADRHGQLSLDFSRRTPGAVVLPFPWADAPSAAERWFRRGFELEHEPEAEEAAAEAYARALAADPDLVPALINLANLHYLRNEPERAHELYRRAETLGGDEYFQIPFNLGNIALDREQFAEARLLYERALLLEPDYANAHFYLALVLEKLGLSAEAKPHWRRYHLLDPDGEWVLLAREMERSD